MSTCLLMCAHILKVCAFWTTCVVFCCEESLAITLIIRNTLIFRLDAVSTKRVRASYHLQQDHSLVHGA